MTKRFEAVLLEEAMEFLQKQNPKSKNKILQNIERASKKTDPKLFKKLQAEIWEFQNAVCGTSISITGILGQNR